MLRVYWAYFNFSQKQKFNKPVIQHVYAELQIAMMKEILAVAQRYIIIVFFAFFA